MRTAISNISNSGMEVGNVYGDDVLCAGWNPALYQRNEISMPPDLLTVNADTFMKRMHEIEVDAEVFLQNMYTCQ